jgi:uncharacterized membrane protein
MSLFNVFLVVHILAGTISLISSPIAIATEKGGKAHRLAGKFFYYGMLVVSLSSFVLAYIKGSLFLFLIGVFSIYLVITGYRILSLKGLGKRTQEPMWYDWVVSGGMFLFGIGLLVYGGYIVYHGSNMGYVLLVFGFSSLRNVLVDYKLYTHVVANKNFWLTQHIGRMLGGTIAAYTAFLVNNSRYFPSWVQGPVLWLFPTVLGSIGVVYFIRKNK